MATIGVRRFELHRHDDVSGVSGKGVVADGVEFIDKSLDILWPDGGHTQLPKGWVKLVWRTQGHSTALYESAAQVERIHGHGGATQLVWLDADFVELPSTTRPVTESLEETMRRRGRE